MTETPVDLGFAMPAEWEKHSAVWLAWPYDPITFPNGRVELVEKKYLEIIQALCPSEPIELLVLNQETKARVSSMLEKNGVDLSRIVFHVTDYADVWIRDYGPTFIKSSSPRDLAWIKWHYNAYGRKFPDLLKDNEVFFNLRKTLDKRMFEPGLFAEGGAIESNGRGVILTTEECLLNPNRNPKTSKPDMEKLLKNYLGAKKIIWLKRGLTGDHTDGHIDELARFVSPTKILCAYESDPAETNHQTLEDNYQALLKNTDATGQPFEVIKMQVPHITYDTKKPFEAGEKAPVSYTNFYIGNEVVLASVFKDPNDAQALETLRACFPERKVIPIDCTDIIYGGGGVHCMTQQEPVY